MDASRPSNELWPGDSCHNTHSNPQLTAHHGNEQPLFSPLALYFRCEDLPAKKKGEKTMIGHNGWLECTEQYGCGQNTQTSHKRPSILNSIRKIAKDVVSRDV